MDRERYQGFILEAGANELQNDLGFSPKLTIIKDLGWAVDEMPIGTVRGLFDCREKAIEAALKHGRSIIDG